MTPIEDQLRSVVIECLQKENARRQPRDGPYQLPNLFRDIADIARSRGLKVKTGHNAWLDNQTGGAELHPNLKGPVRDTIWDLIVEGILRPGGTLTRDEHSLPYLHLTDYGKKAIDGAVTPHDPDGYLQRLTELVPNTDPIITKYIAESAETFRRNCILSTTITLGCASEKAFLVLLDAYKDALTATDQTALDAALKGKWQAKKRHSVFMTWYRSRLKPRLQKDATLKGDWISTLENALQFVFDHFRDMRNKTGHPTGIAFPKEVLHANLQLFPSYLRVIYDLIDWLAANRPL